MINSMVVMRSRDDVIKWKHFPRYWPFVRGIHRSPVNSSHKGQWPGALMFSLICALNERLSKQSWGRWFETSSYPLWRHCNGVPLRVNPWYIKSQQEIRFFSDFFNSEFLSCNVILKFSTEPVWHIFSSVQNCDDWPANYCYEWSRISGIRFRVWFKLYDFICLELIDGVKLHQYDLSFQTRWIQGGNAEWVFSQRIYMEVLLNILWTFGPNIYVSYRKYLNS